MSEPGASAPDDGHRSVLYAHKALPASVWRRVLRRQQDRIYDRFAAAFPPRPEWRVLDLGVAAHHERPEDYFFEHRYPHVENVVAAGLEPPERFERCYPSSRYVQVRRGEPPPFEDQSFDVVFASAVVEHVGDRAAQRAFVREALRIGRRVFLTTPNRWYPVELHTILPLVHYLPAPVYRGIYRRLGFDFFADEANLNLLDRRSLAALVPAGVPLRIERHRFLGPVSNLLLVAGEGV